MTGETRVFFGLGSNMGDKEGTLQEAVRLLDAVSGIQVLRSSSLYETDPVGYVEQDVFYNLVLEADVILPPQALLEETQRIEQQLGRTRDIRWGPRTVDIDILLYGEQQEDTEALCIPHPRMAERAFVLVPLAELVPHQVIPMPARVNVLIEELLSNLEHTDGVRRSKSFCWK
ncbi:2-amino-4-hydroxy-6-hydroxymethyldihydropteridine diphosphokinase [Aneurinibacillus soli]|uniref:2-amino-4-hydroxy-6-hydroxymethyldihydropteridine diphosphokinase n=1 Tax=Aneurinibacillus soli TaxID=1500254 RepID=A0A0U5B3C1_9BACL|nr:2-amino-4-hydroxy-6-hydroxymethyldihydropteridine diphosphokinase [Aneurinibacillus soli]PYE58355.1 2-amino-4-hydroxy-6-hydroxymethyldihydropteridine diphosphokinase [Aneurinibacillus soli]BAU26166.1 Bifunctional folate synthesis protein [Aneurinibacillus soli]